MPEGHTLHRLAGELSATFAGRAVRVTSPQGRFAESAALVDGSVVTGAEAWGKHLFVAFEGGRFVHVHLGLYGTFLVHPVVEEVPDPVRGQLVVGPPAHQANLRCGQVLHEGLANRATQSIRGQHLWSVGQKFGK